MSGRMRSHGAVCFDVGLVFQYPEYQLFEIKMVFQDIRLWTQKHGAFRAGNPRARLRAAGFVGITDKELEKSPFDLSGGRMSRDCGDIAMEPDVLIWMSRRQDSTPQDARVFWRTSAPIRQRRARR